MQYLYVKNSSPSQTRAVVKNLLEAMRQADLDVLHRDTLEQIVAECDRALPRSQR